LGRLRALLRDERALVLAWLAMYYVVSALSVVLYFNTAHPRSFGYVVLFNIGMAAFYTGSFFFVRRYAGRLSAWSYAWRVLLMVVIVGAATRSGNPTAESVDLLIPSLLGQWLFAWLFYDRRPKGSTWRQRLRKQLFPSRGRPEAPGGE
jgi:hypothetical protein